MTEEKKKKSPYDDYMQMATDIYNEQKQQNLKQAENQSALAHAQYQEVNRNINEINKAKGLTDTGYQGDTSVDAYNAYRNSVNSAYSNANASNNQLYSYYLNQMSQLEQAKQNQAFQQEQFEYQKEQDEYQKNWNEQTYNDTIERQKREDVIQTLTYLSDSSFYGDDRLLTDEGKTKLLNYAKSVYGDNIPADILEIINSGVGFNQPEEEKAKEWDSEEIIGWATTFIGNNPQNFNSDGTLTESGKEAFKNAVLQYTGGDWESLPNAVKMYYDYGGVVDKEGQKQVINNILGYIKEYLYDAGAFVDDKITDGAAENIWTTILNAYDNIDEIEDLPKSIQKELTSIPGFEDWLDEYNTQQKEKIEENNKVDLSVYYDVDSKERKEFDNLSETEKNKIRDKYIDEIVNTYASYGNYGVRTFMGTNRVKDFLGDKYTEKVRKLIDDKVSGKINKDWEITGLGSGRNNDNIVFKFDGKSFDLQTGNAVDDATAKELNKLVTGHEDWKPNEVWDENNYRTIKWNEGSFLGAIANSKDTAERLVVKGKKMYLYTSNGWVEVKSRNDNVYDAIEAYLK